MAYTILVVEDEEAIRALIGMAMKSEGHLCDFARDGLEAKALLETHTYNAMILDVMLPALDGFELFEGLASAPPTIFVTARVDVEDRVRGLRMGAEDYLLKPFDVMELIARVNNILQRHAFSTPSLHLGDLSVDRSARRVFRQNQEIELTPQEYALLDALIAHAGQPVSRDQLLNEAWGYDFFGGTRTVDAHIQRLRKKLGLESRIVTVHKIGYRLETEEPKK